MSEYERQEVAKVIREAFNAARNSARCSGRDHVLESDLLAALEHLDDIILPLPSTPATQQRLSKEG